MNLYTISPADTRILENIAAIDIINLVKSDGIDKIEILEETGWVYLLDSMKADGFVWNDADTIEENIKRWDSLN